MSTTNNNPQTNSLRPDNLMNHNPQQAKNIIWLLTASVALMMTGFGIIMPVFARRLGEIGSGVETLGLMTMAFALAQFVAAPFFGNLADRVGRRPIVLFSLAAFGVANIGYLLVSSSAGYIVVRGLAGGLTAGLFPAAMGIVADIVSEKERGKWVGMVMGGYGIGFIFGPVMGGLLYDNWGFVAPFATSAIMAGIALLLATVMVPETRPAEVRQEYAKKAESLPKESLWKSLPKPLYIFSTLLVLDFVGSFAFAFVEPQMVFYLYDDLGWSTAQFGLAVGAYGLAMVIGQTMLGQTSDRFGRKPIIIVGIILNSILFIGLATVTSFGWLIPISALAGLGAGLIAPAISAFHLDITNEQIRSRVMGIKESALALGGVAGPTLVVVASSLTSPIGVFAIAAGLMLTAALVALVVLREQERPVTNTDIITEPVFDNRTIPTEVV